MRVGLTIALPWYDLAYPVTSGEIEIAGTDVTHVELVKPGTYEEFAGTSGWDIGEVPAAEYAARRAAGDDRVIALPLNGPPRATVTWPCCSAVGSANPSVGRPLTLSIFNTATAI